VHFRSSPLAPLPTPQEASHEDQGYMIRSGIVVVLRNATIKDNTVL
jgi:hypothetical protein